MNYVYFDEEERRLKWDASIKIAWLAGGFALSDPKSKAAIWLNVITGEENRFDFPGESMQDVIDKANKYFNLTNDNPDSTKHEAIEK